MKTLLSAFLITVFLVVLAMATGCEDSAATVGKDYEMNLEADPSSLVADPTDPATLTSTIRATIFNATGVPQKGILVYFSSTNGGQLASDSQPVSTDSNGNAYDTLTINPSGTAETSVTATATTLTQTVKVTNGGICRVNTPPTAVIQPSDDLTAPAGVVNTFYTTPSLSGSTSTDLQSPTLTYSWNCGNEAALITTPATTCKYTYMSEAKTYTIRLVVTDAGLNGHPECALPSAPDSITVSVPIGTAAPS